MPALVVRSYILFQTGTLIGCYDKLCKNLCNSEFHAKAIISHIISFLSKNKQKPYLPSLEKKIQK